MTHCVGKICLHLYITSIQN